jgi:hypothetical protein
MLQTIMSAASMTSISKSLRRSTSWADDDDDDWDFNTWKQQIEIEASPEPVTPMESISGSLDKYTSWADDEDDWNFEDWKQQAEKDNSPLTIEELGPLQRQTQEEPTYQTIHPCSNFASSEPMPEEAFATYYTEEQLQLQLTNDPAVYFNDPPTMHWYCINKAEGCDRPQNWRYEYTKTWRALRRNIPTHPKTHRQTPLISSPLALQATVVDDERHSMPAIAKGLVDETGDEHPLTPGKIHSPKTFAQRHSNPCRIARQTRSSENQPPHSFRNDATYNWNGRQIGYY